MKSERIKLPIKMIATEEDWFPPYKTNASNKNWIEVSLHKDSPILYRVAIWGADDFGMEKEFITKKEAMKEYKFLHDNIKKDELKLRGYRNA